jgi:uncharacterized membrane protein YgcG
MEKNQVLTFPKGAASLAADLENPAPQELKAERVQEPSATLYTELKAERVQEPEAIAAAEPAQVAVLCELQIHRPQTVTIELAAAKVAITLHGETAG